MLLILTDILLIQSRDLMKILTTSLLLALSSPAWADIITLKDGSKLNATILSKTLEEYELEVNITNSIKERRTVKRSDVADIEHVNKIKMMYEKEIVPLLPVPPYSPASEYEERLTKIKGFVSEHKDTASGRRAAKMLETLMEEHAFIKEGGLKTDLSDSGKISADQKAENALEIDAQISANSFKKLVETRSYLAALRQYDELERSFFGTQAHRDSVDLMRRLVSSYGSLLQRQLDLLDQNSASSDRLPENQKKLQMQAKEQRMIAFEELHEKEESKGISWLSIDTKNPQSLENMIITLEEETERLDEVESDLRELPEAGDLYRRGWIVSGEKNQEALEEILDQMDQLGLAESYLNALVDRFDPTINQPPSEEMSEEEMMEKKKMMEEEGMTKEEMMEKEKMEKEQMEDK